MDLNALKAQLDATEGQLGQYSANLPSEIETQIQNAYTPALQNSLNTTKDMMGDYLGRYFDITTMGPGTQGTTALDLSPTQKLGVMGRELGTMSGELQATQRFSDYLGGQMKDMYGKALQAAQMGQQNLADQYNRQMQLYQMKWQEAEAAKDRALQDQISRRSYSGGGTVNTDGNTPAPTQLSPQDQFVNLVNQYAQERKNPNRSSSFNIDTVHSLLMKQAQNLGLNITSQQLWAALGNTPKAVTNAVNPASKYFNLNSLL